MAKFAFTLVASLAIAGCSHTNSASHGDAFALIMEYRGDAFALDTGMTLGDCFDAMPRNDVAHHISFACERDPAGER